MLIARFVNFFIVLHFLKIFCNEADGNFFWEFKIRNVKLILQKYLQLIFVNIVYYMSYIIVLCGHGDCFKTGYNCTQKKKIATDFFS